MGVENFFDLDPACLSNAMPSRRVGTADPTNPPPLSRPPGAGTGRPSD
jgi:hypothetical protein